MKKIILLVAAILSFAAMASANTFTNGGFEDGNLGGWTGGGGTWHGGGYPVNPSVYNGGISNNTLMSGGTDPITGQATVYNGSHSVRVNNSVNDYSVSTIKQSVSNYTDKDIFFEWNAVLESSHGPEDSDYFSLTLHDDTTNTDVVSRGFNSAITPGFTQFGNWFGSGWKVEHIDVDALGLTGHDFTLTLLASDCPYGGHAGYVYLDGFSNVVVNPGPAVPEPSTMLLLGAGLVGLAVARKRIKK